MEDFAILSDYWSLFIKPMIHGSTFVEQQMLNSSYKSQQCSTFVDQQKLNRVSFTLGSGKTNYRSPMVTATNDTVLSSLGYGVIYANREGRV